MIALPGTGNIKILTAVIEQAGGRAFAAMVGCQGVRMEADP
jgi:hypothetical protein